MKDISNFFLKLFDTSDWPPRWHCGKWTGFHGWLYIISDVLIWAAYFAIPLIIIRFITYKKHQRFIKLYFLFASFILACGMTHLLDAVTFWVPAYRLSALMRAITAIVSWLTVFNLIKLLPYAFSLKTPELLEAEIDMRKKAEMELKQKNQQLTEAEIIGGFGSFEWVSGADKMECSNGMMALLGLERTATMKLSFERYFSFVHADDRLNEQQLLQAFTGGGTFEKHYLRIVTTKGEEKIVVIRGSVASSERDNALRFICTCQDVTEIKRNKELLEASRQTFQSVFEHSSIGIALVGPEGRWLNANKAVCSMLGYTKEELLPMDFADITHSDDLALDLAYVDRLMRKGIETYQMEKRYYRKDGGIVWVLLSVSLVWHGDRAAFFIYQMVDITAKKLLVNEVETKNTELANANRDLQNHIVRINEFNRIIGHNLRGPVSSLLNLAEFLEGNENEEDRNFLLTQVKGISVSVLNTLNDLKDFLEMQLGNSVQVLVPVSFQEALENSRKVLEHPINEAGAAIHAFFETPSVPFPKVYLESLFYNLLSNALKYRNSHTAPIIHIATKEVDGGTVLTVSDNGIGIDMNRHRNEIFKYKKIFHKGYDSNGVGLFLTKTQVEACDGRIEVDSEPGKGTIFTIFFKKHD